MPETCFQSWERIAWSCSTWRRRRSPLRRSGGCGVHPPNPLSLFLIYQLPIRLQTFSSLFWSQNLLGKVRKRREQHDLSCFCHSREWRQHRLNFVVIHFHRSFHHRYNFPPSPKPFEAALTPSWILSESGTALTCLLGVVLQDEVPNYSDFHDIFEKVNFSTSSTPLPFTSGSPPLFSDIFLSLGYLTIGPGDIGEEEPWFRVGQSWSWWIFINFSSFFVLAIRLSPRPQQIPPPNFRTLSYNTWDDF